MSDVKKETLSGAKWTMLQKMTMQPVQFVYGIILARLISPEEFGILGLTAIFFSIGAQLQDCGFGSSLIRNIHRTEKDINTVFLTNVAMSCLISSTLWFSAPLFVEFFHQPALLWLTRASALMMFLNSTGSVHWTLYTCRRDFKTPAILRTITTLVAMPFTIWAAYAGWGYWALMTQSLISGLLSLVCVWYLSPWKPSFLWSGESFRNSFAYGSKLLVSGIFSSAYGHLKAFLIGKVYTPADLGLFNRAWHLATLPNATINSMLGSVTFPILATLQEDESRLLDVYCKYIRVTSLPIFFGACLLFALAKPAISFIYGPNWVICSDYLQIIIWAVMTYHILTINNNLLLVKGRSDLVLRINLAQKIFAVVVMVPIIFVSVMAICWAALISVPFNIFTSTYYTSKLYGLTLKKQFSDFVPYMLFSCISCAPAYLLTFTSLPDFLKLLFGSLVAILCYWGILSVKKDSAYLLIKQTLLSSKFGKMLSF